MTIRNDWELLTKAAVIREYRYPEALLDADIKSGALAAFLADGASASGTGYLYGVAQKPHGINEYGKMGVAKYEWRGGASTPLAVTQEVCSPMRSKYTHIPTQIESVDDLPPRVERDCEWCGAPFTARRSDIRVGRGRFCSLSCVSLYRHSLTDYREATDNGDGRSSIALSNGEVVVVDTVDVPALSGMNWTYSANGYAFNRTLGLMHRFIANAPNDMQVDHINGDRLDNRRANLRICTSAENGWNRGAPSNSSTGFRGVHIISRTGKFVAKIVKHGKTTRLGTFDDPETAAKAYDDAAKELYGEFARLNLPEEGGDA